MGMHGIVTPAKARLFIAAKRCRDIAFAKAVDRHSARPQSARASDGAFGIGSKDRRTKTMSTSTYAVVLLSKLGVLCFA